ncbi:DUF2786 domain-containing protein [Corynebacterium tapiri]|uniref:DUF2786 domain-containing protein n=1 Tax=Corynebacterium tapiri TaxID=1448266 RepID=A0A5C4U6E4_9CORY|nr:DUF2786 domain-containing protein [Corynebacterium tapiri]TNL99828.1 DUF2786 domain-containing protein [Corynebacterium tapiri]
MPALAIEEKVRKLLALARDQEGTPEADAFYSKAFDLMARYGLEQHQVELGSSEPDVVHRTMDLSGSYTDMQFGLLHHLAQALHCRVVASKKYRSTVVHQANLFGLRRHVERVELLFSVLNATMVAQAQTVGRTVRARRSFMHGFSVGIFHRLAAAESQVATESTSYSLVLINDFEKATVLLNEWARAQGMSVASYTSRRSNHAGAFAAGGAAADRADLGQTRVSGFRALSA